ncbi:hypothetical protein [Flavobacterium turcicum]|uniref:Uncharacterized protein n=1 Tax=Flavobacterium turcicum TaxID=2764718 RepID=A0ABR7JHD5_9FLAO|nr:hypothetical protein [Flavobacterium turcicum]MBC5863559.1 hypothetical protein [Flavobacterium turcicum]NHL02491.1 hypothetical protein [Flavobacterium turcicum]
MSHNMQEDLVHIRSMMERSSRFISLSGLSGVFAGVFALLGAGYAAFLFESNEMSYFDGLEKVYTDDLIYRLIVLAILVLVLALFSGFLFTYKKSKKNNLPIWTSTTKMMLLQLAIPLVVGGVFCLALVYHGLFVFLAPATLLFYGLALVNAGKYTYSDIQYLGYFQLFLGSLSLFFLGYGLIFWTLGFGVLHIVYGTIMFKKYD